MPTGLKPPSIKKPSGAGTRALEPGNTGSGARCRTNTCTQLRAMVARRNKLRHWIQKKNKSTLIKVSRVWASTLWGWSIFFESLAQHFPEKKELTSLLFDAPHPYRLAGAA